MMTSLATTTLLLLLSQSPAEPALADLPEIPGQPDRVDISCTVSFEQGELNGGPDQVTAVHCEGIPGFFVPRTRYRKLSMDSYRLGLIDEKLQLAQKENQEMRAAIAFLKGAYVQASEGGAAMKKNWLEAEDRWLKLNSQYIKDVEEASQRAWYESPLLWVGVGVAVTVATFVIVKPVTAGLNDVLGQ